MAKSQKNYDSIDLAYRELFPELVRYARRHLVRDIHAEDCVQNAFEKLLVYRVANPDTVINRFIMYKETMRECRRKNRQHEFYVDLSNGFPGESLEDVSE